MPTFSALRAKCLAVERAALAQQEEVQDQAPITRARRGGRTWAEWSAQRKEAGAQPEVEDHAARSAPKEEKAHPQRRANAEPDRLAAPLSSSDDEDAVDAFFGGGSSGSDKGQPCTAAVPSCSSTSLPYSRVTAYISHIGSDAFVTELGSQTFSKNAKPGKDDPIVFAVPDCKAQSAKPWLGFGGAFTESACETLQLLSEDLQDEVLRLYFDPREGLGYTLGRVHIGSCDFCRESWTCGDIEPDDEDLRGFSIERYKKAIIPTIKRAAAMVGAPLDILASPWSPPAWMKTEEDLKKGGLDPTCRKAWAHHFVRFIQEFEKEGVPIWAITVQNEPGKGSHRWEGCSYTAEEERDFVRDFLGPALEEAGYGSVKILVWDHNRDHMLERAAVIYADPEAAKYVWGVAYHWYGDARFEDWVEPQLLEFDLKFADEPKSPDEPGEPIRVRHYYSESCHENVRRVAELRPDKHLLFTEGCQEISNSSPEIDGWSVGERYALTLIADINSGCEGFIDWNLCLDQEGGPNHARNFCLAPVCISEDGYSLSPSCGYLEHFSRYIRPGAQRVVCSSSKDALQVTAFVNPLRDSKDNPVDEHLVVVVLNPTLSEFLSFWLKVPGVGATQWSSPPRSIVTFKVERGLPK